MQLCPDRPGFASEPMGYHTLPRTFDELQTALVAFRNESHTENRDILHCLESLHYSLNQLVVVVAGIQMYMTSSLYTFGTGFMG